MQTSVPELTDLSKEPASIHELYGTEPGKASFANNCLLARRLVERGVRFVQLYHRGWDTHGASFGEDIVEKLPHLCRQTDQAGLCACSPTSSSAGCSTTRWSSGAASSAGRR